jgi:ABC-type branched-subunit amino acid transport system ATPase component
MSLVDLIGRVSAVEATVDNFKIREKKLEKEIKEGEQEVQYLLLVQKLFQELIDKEISTSVQVLDQLETEGLQSVFKDQILKVESEVSVLRNKVSVDMSTLQEKAGMFIKGLGNDSFGGSVSTLESLLLRIIVILKRKLRPILFLDESLTAFDPYYLENISEFLKKICKDLNFDIFMITHDPVLYNSADISYRVKVVNDESILTKD